MLIYNISIVCYLGIFLSTLVIIFIYFNFFKSKHKNEIIEFTEQNIFINDKIIPIKNIKSIEKGEILYEEENSKISVNFEFNCLEDNFYLLKKIWMDELSNNNIINKS